MVVLNELKKVPIWAWGVAAAAILGAFLLSRRGAPAAPQDVAVLQPETPASNGQPAGQPRQPSSEDWQRNALTGLLADTRQQLALMSLWIERMATNPASRNTHPSRSTSGGGPVSSVDPPIVGIPSTPPVMPPISGDGWSSSGSAGGRMRAGPITMT